jgi:hypothetical protein
VNQPAVPKIQSSDLKNLNVIFLHPDPEVCRDFEARSEQSMTRVNFFSASKLSEARDILKRGECQLAVFQGGVEGKDFVFMQLEIKNASPKTSMIALIDVPTIDQLTAQHRIGGIHAFGRQVDVSSFDYVVSLISNFARNFSKKESIKEQLEYGKTLQNFLFAKAPAEQTYKDISQKLIEGLSLSYDWSSQECAKILVAETVYCPEVPSDSYKTLLCNDKYQLGSWLSQTASWKIPSSKPTGAAGMAITLANYMASEVQKGIGSQRVVSSVFVRPHFLLHPSIRTLKEKELLSLLQKSIGEESYKAVGNGG